MKITNSMTLLEETILRHWHRLKDFEIVALKQLEKKVVKQLISLDPEEQQKADANQELIESIIELLNYEKYSRLDEVKELIRVEVKEALEA